MQWKRGVVIRMVLYTSLPYDTAPIHRTPLPLPLHPPVIDTQGRGLDGQPAPGGGPPRGPGAHGRLMTGRLATEAFEHLRCLVIDVDRRLSAGNDDYNNDNTNNTSNNTNDNTATNY